MKLDKTGSKTSKKEKWLGALTILLVGLFVLPSPAFVTTSLLHLGFVSHHLSAKDKLVQLGQDLLASPKRYIASKSDMPLLKIDVKYEDWQVIAKDREEAFENGVIAENRHMVGGVINFEGKSYKTKLRLQGDALEHVIGAKRWSLRFDLKNNKAILQNRRFALLSSNVRIHHGPYMFSETMKKAGFDIISPQMNPVKVVVNGVNWGVMLMEETFGQDLLALNNRTPGIVARLDILEETQDDKGHITRKFQPRAIQRTSILKNPELNEHRKIALSLISDFFEGKRSASDVFDHEKLGQYLATLDVWSAWHALSWNNWRWYYNPHTAKLEPIQSDVAVTPAKHYWLTQAISKEFPVALKMLSDEKVKSSYDAALAHLLNLLDQGEMQAHLELKQAKRLSRLHHGMPLISNFDFNIMHQQTRCLYTGYLQSNCSAIPKLEGSLHLHLTHFDAARNWDLASSYISSSTMGGDNTLTLTNTSLQSLKVHSIEGMNKFRLVDELDVVNYVLPIEIQPNEEIVLTIPSGITDLILYAALKSKKIAPFYFKQDHDPLAFLPRPTRTANIDKYPFIEVSKSKWKIKAGDWKINDFLITPENWLLEVAAGTKLTFTQGAGLRVFGRINLQGTKVLPIELTSQSKHAWRGMSVFGNKQKSHISNTFINTTGRSIRGNGLAQDASYFYQTDLKVDNLKIENIHEYNALTLVNSHISIDGLNIKNTDKGAFRCEFCSGDVSNSQFENIGKRRIGDAIELIGSNLHLNNLAFNNVKDRALLVGKNSSIVVDNLNFNQVDYGLVAKSRSNVEATNIYTLNVTHYAAMTYSQIPIFGGAVMKINDLDCGLDNCESKLVTEVGSQLEVNGNTLETPEIDISHFIQPTLIR